MNHLTITPAITKLPYYSSSVNKLRSVAPSKKTKPPTGQFAYALAHEIRNPLTTIKMAGEMLKSMASSDDQKSFLDMIIRSSVQINELLTNFLSSFETDETKSGKHSVHQLLDEALELSEDRIRLKNISIRKEYEARDCKIIMNKPKMKIALTNIIINAIDA
ncbi:MAG: HAMP domain-containing histidine kinase, partial [Bacteroidia bacterium]|nr:HAMP domain-containing histidine kinase [Bacteroidia bacterium]